MRLRLTFFISLVGLLLTNAPARSIVLEKKGTKERVVGYFESEDAKNKKIKVRVILRNGKEKKEDFELSKFTIIHQVDRARLEKLSKDKPNEYQKYALELAENKAAKDDPEAVDLALRLFLIAAYLDTPKLGRSCLERMGDLAAPPADKRKYLAMAFLLDAKSQQIHMKADVIKPAPLEQKALDSFGRILRAYRNGDFGPAETYAQADGVADLFVKARFMDKKSFLKACFEKNFPHSDDHLKAVLKAEIWALDRILSNEPAAKQNARTAGWSSALINGQTAPIPLLRLETITKYDPRECAYRKGTWIVP